LRALAGDGLAAGEDQGGHAALAGQAQGAVHEQRVVCGDGATFQPHARYLQVLVLLCHDGDKAGQRQAQALAAELAAAGVPAERRHPPKPAKDWAEALQRDPSLAAAARHQAAEGQAEIVQHRHR